jgi:hypothetical protein
MTEDKITKASNAEQAAREIPDAWPYFDKMAAVIQSAIDKETAELNLALEVFKDQSRQFQVALHGETLRSKSLTAKLAKAREALRAIKSDADEVDTKLLSDDNCDCGSMSPEDGCCLPCFASRVVRDIRDTARAALSDIEEGSHGR